MSAALSDDAIENATGIIQAALADASARPNVTSFFDSSTCTASYVVSDPCGDGCAIIDSVLDFVPDCAEVKTMSAQSLIEHVRTCGLSVGWLLETHPHADHLSAAAELRDRLGGSLAIGAKIASVQEVFARLFNLGATVSRDGGGFDHLFRNGERFNVGRLDAIALHVPGHTPACMAYVIGDAVFTGDTLFMPDSGTARCDFPGGDAAALYRSIRRLQNLPGAARVFVCHDYKAPGRAEFSWETTMETQRTSNVHVRDGTTEAQFVETRRARDRTLRTPQQYFPSMQVNPWGGRLPEPEDNGIQYLKLPLNAQRLAR